MNLEREYVEYFNLIEYEKYLKSIISDFEFFIRQDRFNAQVINTNNYEFLNYYKSKRLAIIKLLNDKSFFLRVDFIDFNNISVNNDDFEMLLIYPKYLLEKIKVQNKISGKHKTGFVDSMINETVNDLKKYYKKSIKDFENCLKLAYYNHQIKLIENTNSFNKLFNTIECESFFAFAVETWITEHQFKKRAISYLFFMMWSKTNPVDRLDSIKYYIVGSQTKFVEYWNELYSTIYKFESIKQPKLNTLFEITSNKYQLELTTVIDNYKNKG